MEDPPVQRLDIDGWRRHFEAPDEQDEQELHLYDASAPSS